jgi:hypothetical protein
MASYIFARKGYFVAEEPETELQPGNAHNPTGYWEAESVIEANVELFKAVGFLHHNTWLFEPVSDEQAAAIPLVRPMDQHRQLVQRYNAHSPWLWKDPRLCYTLGYWWPLMTPETTGVLLLKRDPEHVFRSLVKLSWWKNAPDREEFIQRLSNHMAAAKKAIAQQGIPHIALAYENFEARPEDTARQLTDFFGLKLHAPDLHFNRLLNHSSIPGRMVGRLEALAASLPAGWRRCLKKLTPTPLLNKLFPGRTK